MIGYGAIADYVTGSIAKDPNLDVSWIMARPGREAAAQACAGRGSNVITSVEQLEGNPDLAIECAGHAAVAAHGPAVLERGIPLGIVSVGALADSALNRDLESAAAQGGGKLDLLSGAVAAIDALAAAREGGLDRVAYTARKPPLSWLGTPAENACDLHALTEEFAFYQGSARDAAQRYPKNANVAATVALAGLGFDATDVRLVADPAMNGNTHNLIAEGAFGLLDVTVAGRPLPDNPKSSALTAMSVVRYLRNKVRQVRI
ncbi:MAG: aspartate dehydrogenase [Alphaproteobacteria bacterium]|nr:aspartate dehydrogenase [Alphaproteobacteria bacterium]